MVKLASARETWMREYGPCRMRERSEYMNAGLYLFSTVVLEMGFVAQRSKEPKSGLVLLLIALALIAAVNLHDLLAHLSGIHYRLLPLIHFDTQFPLVEFAVPLLQLLGSLLSFSAILLIFIQAEKGFGYHKLERHALNLLIVGPVFWLVGSIHNSCQIYETADGHVQVLQHTVHLPFLMASLLFLFGGILNSRDHAPSSHHHGLLLLSDTFVWLGIVGSLLLFMGGLANVFKVLKMQQQPNELRLEKLRGGALESLVNVRDREWEVPLMIDENLTARKLQVPEPKLPVVTTPYKDVLLGRN